MGRALWSCWLIALLVAFDVACTDEAPPPPSPSPAPTPSASIAPAAPVGPLGPDPDRWVESRLRDDPPDADWLERAESLRLQVMVSAFDADGRLEEHGFRLGEDYVYPASAIKTLLAIAALRYVRALEEERGVKLGVNARFKRCRYDRSRCKPPDADKDDDDDDDADDDPHEGRLSLREEIHRLLAYSDNDSYDRLYDLLGHARLNEEMAALGLSSVRFRHRLSTVRDRRRTRRVLLLPWRGRPFVLPLRRSTLALSNTPASRLLVGTRHRTSKGLIEGPMDFSEKNYASLFDLHRATLAVVRPDLARLELGLDEAQREALVRPMTGHILPGKRGATHKPMLPGVLRVLPRERIRYVNKAGRAYGFHLDSAYIEDKQTGRAMMLSAAVYANPNGVLNDDDYAYKETSGPVLAWLGEVFSREVLRPAATTSPAP
ncbi:MAG: serine hydrolase [Myxococcota bacterium]